MDGLYFWTALSSFGVAIFGVEGGGELAVFINGHNFLTLLSGGGGVGGGSFYRGIVISEF